MKTISQFIREYTEKNFPHTISSNDPNLSWEDGYNSARTTYFEKGFKEGVEFAQQFYLIGRDQYSKIDLKQKEELECNMPILVKYLNEDGETIYDVFAEYYPVLQDPVYTHWRPINVK